MARVEMTPIQIEAVVDALLHFTEENVWVGHEGNELVPNGAAFERAAIELLESL